MRRVQISASPPARASAALPLPLGALAPPPPPAQQLCSGRSAPLRSRVSVCRASAVTAATATGTWRPKSPDRAPRQSAPALRALPARSSRAPRLAGLGRALQGEPCVPGAGSPETEARMDASSRHNSPYSDYPKMQRWMNLSLMQHIVADG
ncbi:proline-rich protein 34-like isoform X2 [Pongo pygmaeus]|uniref:proline-rich protein 34-like isoform X2 n=1 Tax=Pongo pygmaeus TaxID=9600 RepID=UPI00300CF0EF